MNFIGMISMVFISQSIDFGEIIHLPQANVKGAMSLEESIAKRRSIREFASKPLTIEQIGQLLWATQGITEKRMGLRAAPSAGALYPLETYVVLLAGIYHYNPERHELKRVIEGDKRLELQKAALDQEAIGSAPAVIVIAAVYERTSKKYEDRASRYVHIEAGHACQNLLLQATAQNLAGVPIGAFNDKRVADIVKMAKNESPLYLVPVGYRVD
ncbi:MAG: SagB/ThcOx family dehydrogenase [Methylococcaceae bacterium]|jgi:SagB-type dehydrogenase family enzyme